MYATMEQRKRQAEQAREQLGRNYGAHVYRELTNALRSRYGTRDFNQATMNHFIRLVSLVEEFYDELPLPPQE